MNRKLTKRKESIITLAAIFAAGVCVALSFPYFVRLIVAGHKATGMPVCFLNDFFDIRCPLCGGTRCVNCLMNFKFMRAVWYNPMVVLSGLMICEWYIRSWVRCIFRKDGDISPSKPLLTTLIILWAVFAVIRNFPFYRAIFY